MNVVALVGNLATDPELRHTAGGRAVCTFRVAVSRAAANEAEEEHDGQDGQEALVGTVVPFGMFDPFEDKPGVTR